MENETISSFSFTDFPEDVQLCILSFLTPSDISSFACTSRRHVSLSYGDNRVWYALCDRRWGSHTQIRKWGDGNISFKLLFNTLSQFENLIGFWRRSGSGCGSGPGPAPSIVGDAPLVYFEWGDSCVTGSRVSPSKDGSYGVVKCPFIWMSLSCEGEQVNYVRVMGKDREPDMDVVRVSVGFMGKGHVVLEECRENGNGNANGCKRNGNLKGEVGLGEIDDGLVVSEIGSPPDRVTSEMYQYFANRTSPGASGERAWRRQRRREKERQGRRKWEPEHLVKIVHSSPSLSHPLQGLWKGICDDMKLDFYLVAYDDIGGIACRRVGDSSKPFSGYAPVFWTSNATLISCPLSHEEDYLYNTRMHLCPTGELEEHDCVHCPSHIMYINSSYDLVIPNLMVTSANPRCVEGRIWHYVDGTFGYGFIRDNYIVDLKHIAKHGRLLDTIDF